VLVADDEPAILRMLEVGLALDGFTVWAAASGQEALDLFRQHASDIQVVLLDVQMPGLDGPQTLLALRSLRPELPCCFMSGGTGAYSEQDLLDAGAARVFAKPFSLAEVLEFLRQVAGHPDRRAGSRSATPPTPVSLGGQQARLRDRSNGGLGLWAFQSVEVGSVVDLRYDDGTNPQCSVEVRHCRPGDGGWIVGCRFVG